MWFLVCVGQIGPTYRISKKYAVWQYDLTGMKKHTIIYDDPSS